MADGAGPSKRIRYGDSNYEEQAFKWFDEFMSGSDKDSESEYEVSDHNSESEQECDQNDIEEMETMYSDETESEDAEQTAVPGGSKHFYGKNRYKWSSESFVSRSRTQKHNIITRVPTLRGNAALLGDKAYPMAVWNLLISDEMLDNILHWTNEKIERHRQKFTDTSRAEHQHLDAVELKAFISLLFYTAIFISNHEHIDRIFATDGSGRDIFCCVLSKQRFAFLLSCLRFDNPLERQERRKENPTSPISEVFEKYVSNSQAIYSLGTNCCIDEMLVSFRGRSKYKMYMPNKPCKYGIKIVCMTDSRTHYFFNGYI